MILGIVGGLLGSFFNYMNAEINILRKFYLRKRWQKVLDTMFFTAITAAMLYFAPYITASDCIPNEGLEDHVRAEFIEFTCAHEEYNPLATLLLNPEGNQIKALMDRDAFFAYNPLLLHFMIWFLMTTVTYGTAVPAGLFLPGILLGCTLGRMLTLFIETNIEATVEPATFAIIGAAAVLAGYSRLTFSLAVIMLETTENVNLFLPIIFTLFISFAVGRLFNRSMYIAALGTKAVPFLMDVVPRENTHLKARDMSTQNLISLNQKATLSEIADVLQHSGINGFPVFSRERMLVGLVSSHTLYVLLKLMNEGKSIQEAHYKQFLSVYDTPQQLNFADVRDICDQEPDTKIDLYRFMVPRCQLHTVHVND